MPPIDRSLLSQHVGANGRWLFALALRCSGPAIIYCRRLRRCGPRAELADGLAADACRCRARPRQRRSPCKRRLNTSSAPPISRIYELGSIAVPRLAASARLSADANIRRCGDATRARAFARRQEPRRPPICCFHYFADFDSRCALYFHRNAATLSLCMSFALRSQPPGSRPRFRFATQPFRRYLRCAYD